MKMATIPETAFQRAIRKFRQGLTDEQRRNFATSSEDVYDEIQKIQDRYGPMKKLRSLTKLSKFLEAMSQIEQLVQIFLNVSDVVAFVWGPIKLALLVAGTRLETLESLLDTYVEVGEVIPGLRQYDQLFKAAPSVLEILERYFCDILEFHRNALEVFSSPTWKAIYDSTWKTFKTRFKPILESLKRHRTLLLDERLNAAIIETQSSRTQILKALDESGDRSKTRFECLERHIREIFTKLSEQIYGLQQSAKEYEACRHESTMQEISSIVNKLDPPDFEADQLSILNSCHRGSGEWIFENPAFRKWAHSKGMPDTVLFIHGMPGAGKTLIASRIIGKLRLEVGFCHTTCLFFYFKHSNDAKRSMTGMLRALLIQLMYQDNTLVPAFYEKCSVVGNAEARQLHSLKAWAIELLKSQNTCTIILDGLDECYHHNGQNEARKILEWFLLTVIPGCEREGAIIRLLVLGQKDGDLDDALSGYPSIGLNTVISHTNDVESYSRTRASEIGQRFALDLKEESHIVHKVTEKAKGMFLYAKVVMDNLMAQGSAAELDEELQTKFPAGLDQAYERVVFRVLDCHTRPEKQREAAARILGWLTCAIRPLRWNEIQCLFCIDPHLGLCNPKNRRVDNCKSLCGSFVEVDDLDSSITKSLRSSPVVNLVHETARRYLIQTRRVNLLEENARMAIWSSAYLASSPFRREIDDSSILEIALGGYYGLQEYAVSSFQSHIDLSLKQAADLLSTTTQSLRRTLFMLIKRLDLDVGFKIEFDDLDSMRICLGDNDYEALTRGLEQMTTSIRKVTEDIKPTVLDDRTRHIFHYFNGNPRFRCPRLKCLMFSHGFEDKKSRDAHAAQHYSQLTCSADGCPRRTIGFLSLLDLEKHKTEAHTSLAKQLNLFPSSKNPKDIWSACAEGDIEFVKNFHALGGNLQAARTKKSHITPIWIAARNNHLSLCEYLVLNGCYAFNSGSAYSTEYSAAGEAIRSCNMELFNILLNLSKEAEIDKLINGSHLAYHIAGAVHSGEHSFVNPFLSMRSNRREHLKDIYLFECLLHYQTVYKPAAVSLLEELFSSIESKDATKILTKRDSKNRNELHWACVFESSNSVAFLLQRMETQNIYALNKDGDTPLSRAIRRLNTEIVRLFIEHDRANGMAPCDSRQNRPLHVACRYSSAEIVKLLIPYSFNHLNEGNVEGDTPLNLAVISEREAYEKVQALLETGEVDLYKGNLAGQTVFNLETTAEIQMLLHSFDIRAGTTDAPVVGNKTVVNADENTAEAAAHSNDGLDAGDDLAKAKDGAYLVSHSHEDNVPEVDTLNPTPFDVDGIDSNYLWDLIDFGVTTEETDETSCLE